MSSPNDICAACGHARAFHQVGTGSGVPVGVEFCDDRHGPACDCKGFKSAPSSSDVPGISSRACARCKVHHVLDEFCVGQAVRVHAKNDDHYGNVGRVVEWGQYGSPIWYRVELPRPSHAEELGRDGKCDPIRRNFAPCELEDASLRAFAWRLLDLWSAAHDLEHASSHGAPELFGVRGARELDVITAVGQDLFAEWSGITKDVIAKLGLEWDHVTERYVLR